MWQPTASVLVVTFWYNIYDMDRVDCGEDDIKETTINSKNIYHGYDT